MIDIRSQPPEGIHSISCLFPARRLYCRTYACVSTILKGDTVLNKMSKNNNHYNKEHTEFKRWVSSLDRTQLLNAMSFAFQEDGPSNNNIHSSHEYELLLEMIRLQAPPSTPIHPQVGGGRDGRNETARILRDRTKRPRLFQFFERRSISFAGGSPPPGPGRRRNRDRNNGVSSAQRKRVFDVTATAKCVQPWGDAYNMEISQKILDQDEIILKYTVSDPAVVTEKDQTYHLSYHPTSKQQKAAAILRMLKEASRGYFLSMPHYRKRKVPVFCAPWLDPTNRWFSLPMYLASRYEVALWDSFQDDRRTIALQRDRPWDDIQEKLKEDIIWSVIQKAMNDTLLKDILPKEVTAAATKIRESLLFELLSSAELQHLKQLFFCQSTRSSLTLSQALKSIYGCPLVEVGTSIDQVRLYLRQRMQEQIQVQMEKQLLNALAEGGPEGTGTTPGFMPGRRNRKKKGRKKNRKRKPIPQKGSRSKEQSPIQHDNSAAESSDEESDASPTQSSRFRGEQRVTFPDNGTPFVERNKNIVLCLGMLNDIINETFRKVGLEGSSDESDSSVVRSNKQGEKAEKPPIVKRKADAQKTIQHRQSESYKQPARQDKQESLQFEDTKDKRSYQVNESSAGYSPQASEEDPLDISTPSGSFDTFPCFPPGFFHRPFGSNPWGFHDGCDDGWGMSNRFPARERSLLAEFFLEQERADANRQDRIIASSTAASLASSTDKNNEDTISISDKFFISLDNGGTETPASDIDVDVDIPPNEISPEEFPSLEIYQQQDPIVSMKAGDVNDEGEISKKGSSALETKDSEWNDSSGEKNTKTNLKGSTESHSVSPEAPSTPSPRLSPILLSLDDLREIREGTQSAGKGRKLAEMLPPGVTLTVPASLPNSPVVHSKRPLVASLSREDLRIDSFRDEDFNRKDRYSISRSRTYTSEPASYRNVAAKSMKPAAKPEPLDGFQKYPSGDARSAFLSKHDKPVDSCARSETAADYMEESQNSGGAVLYRNRAAKSVKSVSDGSWNANRFNSERVALPMRQEREDNLCARSETAIEGHEDYHNWNDSRRTNEENPDNITVGRDGSTTITSAMSHRGESEEVSNLREERNTFRDMCLTLGAEVAKLRNQLATQNGTSMYPAIDYSQSYVQPVFSAASFDPECMPPFFQKGQALAAMSDAGIHRDNMSQISEDEEAKVSKGDPGRRTSSGNTVVESDVSVEYTSSSLALHAPVGLPVPSNKDGHDPMSVNGLQTRLTQDIMRFLTVTETQHRKLDKARNAAVERMTRLVNTLWPRAQVKLYGSHLTGLCLPSSDLDFVICLPAVHKNAPAVAPGVLEGRSNAINETSQKLLARKLKGESWIDPLSMQLLERTVVPVNKVATKDTRAKTMQLDISFDSPERHGLEAVVMVKQIVEELPMIRPLVLVLKQFLLS